MRSFLWASAFSAVLLLPLSAQTPAAGWSGDTIVDLSGAERRLSTGEVVTWDGQTVIRSSADGLTQATLFSLPTANFGGILAVDPTESFAVVGVGSVVGELYQVDLTVGGGAQVGALTFNFDASFSPDGWLGISAPSLTGGVNAIWRLDPIAGTLDEVVNVAGPSGPLDFDAAGNLLYAPSTFDFPQAPGTQDVLEFAKADLDGLAPGSVLVEADGTLVASGFDGAGSLVMDRAAGTLYLAENNFGSGLNRIRRVLSGPADSPVLYEGPTGQTISLQDLIPATGGAAFERFQPEIGGSLTFSATNFYSVFERRDLRPARPQVALTGAGTTGLGAFSVEVDGALPGGAQFLLYAPSAALVPEFAVPGLTPPIFLGMSVGSVRSLPFPFVADGLGELDLSFFNVTGSVGAIAIQMLVLDEAVQPLATTPVAIL